MKFLQLQYSWSVGVGVLIIMRKIRQGRKHASYQWLHIRTLHKYLSKQGYRF